MNNEKLNFYLDELQFILDIIHNSVNELRNDISSIKSEILPSYIGYTVKEGDTLLSILNSLGILYNDTTKARIVADNYSRLVQAYTCKNPNHDPYTWIDLSNSIETGMTLFIDQSLQYR